MYDDVQPRVPYLSSTRSHCPHPFPTNQISTPIAIFYGGNDTLVDIQALITDLPEVVGVWEVPNYEHLGMTEFIVLLKFEYHDSFDLLISLALFFLIDFLWAEGLDKHVYPQILQLLETHSFNGHISSQEEGRKTRIKRSASNGTGTHLREIRTLVRELEGHYDDYDTEGNHSNNASTLTTPNRSPKTERHSFVSRRSSQVSVRHSAHNYIDGQEQQYQA